MKRSSAVFTKKDIKVENPKIIVNIFVILLEFLKIFDIKYYVITSKTSESMYIVIFDNENSSKAIKIRFSNH